MKKNIRKFLSLLLIPMMLACLLPTTALADDDEFPAFAADAPIATITIDKSKLSKDNLLVGEDGMLDGHSSNSVNFYIHKDGYVYADDVPVKNGYKKLGVFTLIYKDAAIMRNGTRKNLEVVFDEVHVIGSDSLGSDGYTDNLRIAYAGDPENGKPLSIAPRSEGEMAEYFCLRAEIKFRVGKAGEMTDEDESFFITLGGIDTRRDNNFSVIHNHWGNAYYSESVEPMHGINSESEIYRSASTNLINNGEAGEWLTTSAGSYGRRFIKDGGSGSLDPYDFTIALVGRAGGQKENRTYNGFITRAWVSYGPDADLDEIYFLNDDLTHTSTSSSGANGMIELWTDGTVDSLSAINLPGGTEEIPHIYTVPNGKTVTYKMASDEGYELDALMVNGRAAQPETVLDRNGDIAYYTYTFDGKQTANQTIAVTWKLIKSPTVTITANAGI